MNIYAFGWIAKHSCKMFSMHLTAWTWTEKMRSKWMIIGSLFRIQININSLTYDVIKLHNLQRSLWNVIVLWNKTQYVTNFCSRQYFFLRIGSITIPKGLFLYLVTTLRMVFSQIITYEIPLRTGHLLLLECCTCMKNLYVLKYPALRT